MHVTTSELEARLIKEVRAREASDRHIDRLEKRIEALAATVSELDALVPKPDREAALIASLPAPIRAQAPSVKPIGGGNFTVRNPLGLELGRIEDGVFWSSRQLHLRSLGEA